VNSTRKGKIIPIKVLCVSARCAGSLTRSQEAYGDSTSPTKLDVNVCLLCTKSVTDAVSLECVWCGHLQHRSCIKISDDQYCILANFPTNIVYFCTPCFQKLPSALGSCDIVDEINSATNVNLKSFEFSLTYICQPKLRK